MRPFSKISPDWWDFTTLDRELLDDAARLTVKDLEELARPGFTVSFYDTFEEFWLAEAMEYINAWRQSTESNPAGICGPIGPTEQLPVVARLVNDLELDVRAGHFWGMDEWLEDGRDVDTSHPLNFARADMELCFDRIRPELQIPKDNLHFPSLQTKDQFSATFEQVRCVIMQGGQGEVKHWAFNDPPKREGRYSEQPPSGEEYRRQGTRRVELHPLTLVQNARTSAAGDISGVPTEAVTVGPAETWKAETVSIWHPGWHDTPFGIRLTSLMISKRIVDSAVPMSLLADHPDVRFNYFRPGIREAGVEMH